MKCEQEGDRMREREQRGGFEGGGPRILKWHDSTSEQLDVFCSDQRLKSGENGS